MLNNVISEKRFTKNIYTCSTKLITWKSSKFVDICKKNVWYTYTTCKTKLDSLQSSSKKKFHNPSSTSYLKREIHKTISKSKNKIKFPHYLYSNSNVEELHTIQKTTQIKMYRFAWEKRGEEQNHENYKRNISDILNYN